jgi:hypothetical protein
MLINDIKVHNPVIFQSVGGGILAEECFGNFGFFGEEVCVWSDVAFVMISEEFLLEKTSSEPSNSDVG